MANDRKGDHTKILPNLENLNEQNTLDKVVGTVDYLLNYLYNNKNTFANNREILIHYLSFNVPKLSVVIHIHYYNILYVIIVQCSNNSIITPTTIGLMVFWAQ